MGVAYVRLLDIERKDRDRNLLSDVCYRVTDGLKPCQIRQDATVVSDVIERDLVEHRDKGGLVEQCSQLPLSPEPASEICGCQHSNTRLGAPQALIHLESLTFTRVDGNLVEPDRHAQVLKMLPQLVRDS